MASRAKLAIWEEESLHLVAEVAGVDLQDPLFNHHHRHETHNLKIARLLEGLANEVLRLQAVLEALEECQLESSTPGKDYPEEPYVWQTGSETEEKVH